MELSIFQIIFLGLLGSLAILDSIMLDFGFRRCVVLGLITGMIVGDVQSGLYIGGTLGLLILGIGTYGGASMPDYQSATIIATTLVATSNGSLDASAAIAIAVPVGLLLLNFDILARYCNSFIVALIEKKIDDGSYEKAYWYNYLGIVMWSLSRFIPITIALILGTTYIQQILDWISSNAQWFLDGLKIAGGILPVVGISILLRYLPIKKYYYYCILGFLLVGYLNKPITGVALFGFVIAVVTYQKSNQILGYSANVEVGEDEDEIDE